jgi:hypothetical protein
MRRSVTVSEWSADPAGFRIRIRIRSGLNIWIRVIGAVQVTRDTYNSCASSWLAASREVRMRVKPSLWKVMNSRRSSTWASFCVYVCQRSRA